MNKAVFVMMCCMFLSVCAADAPKKLFDAVAYQDVAKQSEATFDEKVIKALAILHCFSSHADTKLGAFRYGVGNIVDFQKKYPVHPSSLKIMQDLLEKIKALSDKQVEK